MLSIRLGAAAIIAAMSLAAGCSLPPPELPDPSTLKGQPSWDGLAAERAAGEAAFEARGRGDAKAREEALKKAISHFEKVYATDPNDRENLVKLSKATYYLANYFTEEGDDQGSLYERGRAYAEAALLTNPKVRELYEKNDKKIEKTVAAAGPGDVPALFWLGVNWGRWGESKGLATRAVEAPKIKVCEERLYVLGESFEWGGVHRFFGVYYIKAPGQPEPVENSKKHFETATTRWPQDLENFVLYAEYFAVWTQDEELFKKLLDKVLATPEAQDLPDLRLPNWLARRKAKQLLEEQGELF